MPLDIPDALRATRADAARILRARDKLVAETLDRVGRGRLVELDRDLIDVLDRLRIDPCDASPDVPLVLLPVRVECKTSGSTLRVRVTPDEIHVDALARTLSDLEAESARTWWRAVWTDAASPVPWTELVETVGSDRAAWAARAMTPLNLDGFGAGDPQFPDPPTEVANGSVARCLPDRFVVTVSIAGRDPITVVGPPIPRDVPISPLALGDDDVVDIAGLRVPAGSEWAVSFDEAKKIGLGIEVPLPRGATAIDSVVVVGTRNSVAERDNARDLGDLLVSHAFSDGFDLLAHGMPTNNAQADRSPYRTAESMGAPATAVPAPSAQAAAVARLLGVDGAVVESLLTPDGTRSTLEAAQRAANTALWWTTWEPVLKKVDEADIPAVTPATIESARRLHRDDVRGAGHSSTIRVGAQPYGILPVSDLDAWEPESGDISAALVPLVRRVLARWTARAQRLPRIRPGDEVSDEALLEMLGTNPTSTGVRARPAVDGPQISTLAAATGAPVSVVAAEKQLAQAVMSQYSVELGQRLTAPALQDLTRTIALPLVSARDAEVVATILADGAPQVDSVLQALLDIAWDEAKAAQLRAAPSTYVGPLLDFLRPDAQIVALAQAAMSSSIDTAVSAAPAQSARELFAAASTLRSTVHFDGQPTEAISLAAIEPVAEARTSFAQVALELGDTPEARWVGQEAIAGILELFGMRWETRDAMTALAAAPIDERRIAVASALDVASHRVDAWATGIVAARQRALSTDEGITIGAFGYLEDLRLGVAAREPEGWLHAPSPSHAVAEGVLASAHRSRIGATQGAQPFAIDLSSRRGGELRRILEGMRRGQTIGAMLGYQIERGLTRSAGRFQLTLRQLAPLNTEEVANEAASRGRTARMAAADVVDGVDLLRRFPLESLDAAAPPLRTKLSEKPVNAYIDGAWPAVTDEEWATVVSALRGAAETLDAVSDALLAESVLHYVSGNPSRASAAMDAAGSGGAVDPDLDVLGVRQAGRTLTHNAYVVIPEGATGWSSTRPRAVAEPRLEAWAARRLGDPGDIVVSDGAGGRLTLADAGFAALDLVFADDLPSLVRDLRAALPAMGDVVTARGPSWPRKARPLTMAAALAATLRSIAAGGNALTPDRLVGSGDPAQHAIDRDELLGRCTTLLDALADALEIGEATIGAIDPLTLAIAEADVADLRAAVEPLAAFGVTLSPNVAVPTDAAWAVGAWEGASARYVSATAMLDALAATAADLVDAQVLTRVEAIAESILGDGFPILPVLRHIDGEGNDFADAVRKPLFPAPPPARLAAFVRDHAAVHVGLGRLAEAQLIGRAAGAAVPLTAVQLTLRAADGSALPGTDRWLAGDLPDGLPWPAHPVTHVVLELVGTPAASTDAVAGILFDSWVEMLPFQPDAHAVGDDAVETPLRDARATTGLAVHAHQASARAPQVILSAVSPDGARWTTDSLVATVRSAVALSKARLVTLESVPGDAAILPAIYVASRWLQVRKGFAFHDLAQVSWSQVAYPFLSEVK